MIQLYHIYDTFALAVEYLEDTLGSAPGAPPRAGRPAGLCADGTLRERGGARAACRPARAATRGRARGVPLVHRARCPWVARIVPTRRGAGGAATPCREPAVLAAGARRAGVHRSRDALRRGGGRHSGIRAGRAAVPLFRAGSRRPHAGRSGRALLQCCNRCPRRRRAARAGRHGRRVPAGKAARRRLQRIGAVAIKNSVYVLPHTEQATEDFQWVRRDIVAGGGEASVCQAAFVDGLSDRQIEALFRAQRDAEYAELARAAAEVAREGGGERESSGEVARLERRLAEIVALDHFGAAGRRAAEAAMTRARYRHKPAGRPRLADVRHALPVHGRTWVTRGGVHVDRIASAWLIRRFIDPKARFRFVAAQDARTAPDELRFDMFEAEYTHEGDRCTFETLAARFGLIDPGRAGIVRRHASDDARLERGAAVLDDLYEAFRGRG